MNFYNKNNFILSSQGYSDVVAPGAGGSDPAECATRSTKKIYLFLFTEAPSRPRRVLNFAMMRLAESVNMQQRTGHALNF